MASDLGWAKSYPGECVSCGFLGQYQTGMPDVLLSVAAGHRADGSFRESNRLWCLRRAANLEEEVTRKRQEIDPLPPGQNLLHEARRRVMQESGRNCPQWYEWVEYFDPRWHYEDWRMLRLEEDRKEWLGRLSEMELRAQNAILDAQNQSLEIMAGFHAEQRKSSSLGTKIALTALVLALVGIFGADPQSPLGKWLVEWFIYFAWTK